MYLFVALINHFSLFIDHRVGKRKTYTVIHKHFLQNTVQFFKVYTIGYIFLIYFFHPTENGLIENSLGTRKILFKLILKVLGCFLNGRLAMTCRQSY